MRKGIAIPAAVVSGAVLLAFLPATPEAPAGDARAATLRIGLVNTLFRDAPEPLIQVMARPFKSLMEDQAGVVGEVVVGGDAAELAVKLKDDKVQLGVFQGFEFAWARLKAPDLKPLMIAVNQQSFARAVLVVRQDSKATDVADLKGKAFALPRLVREHARIFVERRCVEPGVPLEKWFGKVAAPTNSEEALDELAEGRVQATVVDDVELEAYRKTCPKTAARLRVLQESEVFPCPVVAYHQSGTISEDTLRRLRTGMIAAKGTPRGRNLLNLCRISGFEAVPADYEQALTDILKVYPPPQR